MCVIWYLGYNRNAHTNHESSRDHESRVVTNHEITRGAESRKRPTVGGNEKPYYTSLQNEDLKITFDQSKKGGGS